MVKAQVKKLSKSDDAVQRLILLREKFADNSAKYFADTITGIGYKRWNNFENGSPISKDAIITLCQKLPGISSDWILFGKVETLSLAMQVKLGYLPPPPDAST